MSRTATDAVLNKYTLSKIGLFTQWDISRWGKSMGISPIYLEVQDRITNPDHAGFLRAPGIVVLNSDIPGKVIKRFRLNLDMKTSDLRNSVRAWVEEHYDIPMEYVYGIGGFPKPLVDQLVTEVQWILDVDSKVAEKSEEIAPASISVKTGQKSLEKDEVRV